MRSRISRLVRTLISSTHGNVALITAIAAPILGLGVAGVLTVAEVNGRVTELQDNLDAAVLAGVSASANPGEQIDVASRAFAATAAGIKPKFVVRSDTLTGTVDASVEALLPGLLGIDSIPVSVQAAARRPRTPICILALNQAANGAFEITGGPRLEAPQCGVHANSASTWAMTQKGESSRAHAMYFGVHGGHDTTKFTPEPVAGAPRIEDPLKNVPFPHHRRCDDATSPKGLVIDQDTTLQPGVYCGGLNITGKGIKVTMAPGQYVMVGGPLLVNGNARLEGSNVLVAFTGQGATLRAWGNSTITLTSPETGVYANIQFLQDRRDGGNHEEKVSIGGNGGPNDPGDDSKLDLQGAMYFPTQAVWIYGRAKVEITTPGLAMVADQIWIQGAAAVDVRSANPRGLRQFKSADMAAKGAWLVR